jgi:hypothetical protein
MISVFNRNSLIVIKQESNNKKVSNSLHEILHYLE